MNQPPAAPEISIGLPVYNGAAYLSQAIESLLAQSFVNFEIIISDNASNDSTADIIAGFAARDPRLRSVRQRENIGVMANFGYVLDAARAPFFVWAAYDDWHDTNYLEALHAALCKNVDMEMAVARIVCKRLDGSTSEITETSRMRNMTRVKRITRMLSLARGGTIYGMYRTGAIRKAFAKQKKEFSFVWAVDHLIIFPFYINDRVVGVPETNFYNRDTGRSAGLYRPDTTRELWRFMCAFLRFSAREVMQSRLAAWEKVICLIYLIPYSNSKAIKWRRLLVRLLLSEKEAR